MLNILFRISIEIHCSQLSLNASNGAPIKATYHSAKEVDDFERLWHSNIFVPSLKAAISEVSCLTSFNVVIKLFTFVVQ